MTELQWLIKILTTQKLSSVLKDMFIERIGEVEGQLSQRQAPRPLLPVPTAQAPSTQRILDEMAQEPRIIRAPTPVPDKIDKETGRAMVNTGKGTSGPRKF